MCILTAYTVLAQALSSATTVESDGPDDPKWLLHLHLLGGGKLCG